MTTPLDSALAVVRTHFGSTPSIVDATEVCISAMCTLLLADTEGCVAVILEGPASSGKTTVLDFLKTPLLRKEKGLVVASDSFTPASFVSHAANMKEGALKRNDLLPRIQNRTLVVPDLAPIFSSRKEDLERNIGVLTRVLDGHGYESDSGTHGHRGYTGDYRFTLLAATTPLEDTTWRAMGRVGNRILMFEVGSEESTIDELVAQMLGEISYVEKVSICAGAVEELLLGLFEKGYGSVEWSRGKDDVALAKVIASVAKWVVKCRGTVTMDEDDDYKPPRIEKPARLITHLYSLARGHAIASGRRCLTKDDVALVVRVALDSMPMDRRGVVRALLAAEEGLTSAQVKDVVGRSLPTARKGMDELVALGAVVAGKQVNHKTVSLPESEQWLRGSWTPS